MSKPYTVIDLRKAEHIQILHPQFQTALERLNHFHNLWRQGAAARHLLLVGASGTGKTSVLHSFARQHPSMQGEEGAILPIVYVRVLLTPGPGKRPSHPVLVTLTCCPIW